MRVESIHDGVVPAATHLPDGFKDLSRSEHLVGSTDMMLASTRVDFKKPLSLWLVSTIIQLSLCCPKSILKLRNDNLKTPRSSLFWRQQVATGSPVPQGETKGQSSHQIFFCSEVIFGVVLPSKYHVITTQQNFQNAKFWWVLSFFLPKILYTSFAEHALNCRCRSLRQWNSCLGRPRLYSLALPCTFQEMKQNHLHCQPSDTFVSHVQIMSNQSVPKIHKHILDHFGTSNTKDNQNKSYKMLAKYFSASLLSLKKCAATFCAAVMPSVASWIKHSIKNEGPNCARVWLWTCKGWKAPEKTFRCGKLRKHPALQAFMDVDMLVEYRCKRSKGLILHHCVAHYHLQHMAILNNLNIAESYNIVQGTRTPVPQCTHFVGHLITATYCNEHQ